MWSSVSGGSGPVNFVRARLVKLVKLAVQWGLEDFLQALFFLLDATLISIASRDQTPSRVSTVRSMVAGFNIQPLGNM